MAQRIYLRNAGRYATVDDADYDRLHLFHWRMFEGYAARSITIPIPHHPLIRPKRRTKKVIIFMHREVMNATDGVFVDHRDGDKLNNTRSNLRLATKQQNCSNRRKNANNSSGYAGVSYKKETGRWSAAIGYKGKSHHIGYYDTPEEAARARDAVALTFFGEFANPNFKDGSIAPSPIKLRRGKFSKYRGVSWLAKPKKWAAHLKIESKPRRRIYLGRYNDPADAAKAYDIAAYGHFGASAILNFGIPDESAAPARALPRFAKKSRYRGVCWRARKWAALITCMRDGKSRQVLLGYFRDEVEAAQAYDRAAVKYHAAPVLNFPI